MEQNISNAKDEQSAFDMALEAVLGAIVRALGVPELLKIRDRFSPER